MRSDRLYALAYDGIDAGGTATMGCPARETDDGTTQLVQTLFNFKTVRLFE
jgi:hypothetical protein